MTDPDLQLAGDRAIILGWMRENSGVSTTDRVAVAVNVPWLRVRTALGSLHDTGHIGRELRSATPFSGKPCAVWLHDRERMGRTAGETPGKKPDHLRYEAPWQNLSYKPPPGQKP